MATTDLTRALVSLAIGWATLHTAAGQCGTTIYDTGGSGGNYGNSQNLTWTYCAPPGQYLTITFTYFDTELDYDWLSIHDGATNAAPMLGEWSGTGNIGSYTTSTPGGCLTLWFTSDFIFTYGGWAATITCTSPPAGDCVYQLNMFDTFGDGWDGSTVGISINGGPFSNYTITGAQGSAMIGVNIGAVVVVQFTNNSPFPDEMSYSLTLGGGVLFSSGSPPATGIVFTNTVTCDPPPAAPQDCLGATTICSGQQFNNNSNNTGAVMDLNASNQGCLSLGERQGTWYVFSPSASGTIGFSLTPTGLTDYDFAIWGPYPDGSTPSTICPPAGPPIRCSYDAPGPYTTGLATGAGDNSEDALGDGWVNSIPVTVGQVYIMYIDNWSNDGQSFSLSWQLTNGASLDCTVLPIELVNFNAQVVDEGVALSWTTATEQNSDHFEVERSFDGEHFVTIGILNAAGESQQQNNYSFLDRQPQYGLNHYRLRLVDTDGDTDGSGVRIVQVDRGGSEEVLLVPNPGTDNLQVLLASTVVDGSTFLLVDATGRTVSRFRTQNTRMEINTAVLPKGLYGFRLLAPDGSIVAHGIWVRE